MPRFAAIDIGSNAMRLRVVEVSHPDEINSFREVESRRAAVRLGMDAFSKRELSPDAIRAACVALRDFRKVMEDTGVVAYRATATSAVRETRNADLLVERARREADILLEVIEGVEEARILQVAVSRKMPVHDSVAWLIDVGGGSTELTRLVAGNATYSVSLPLGTVRLLGTFLGGTSAIDAHHHTLLLEAIDRTLSEVPAREWAVAKDAAIATGGNVDTLAALIPSAQKVLGSRAIDVGALRSLIPKLCQMTTEERRTTFGLRPDRADTLVPACCIFLRIAERLGLNSIAAPGVGLKEGLLLELVERHFHLWDDDAQDQVSIDACIALGRRFGFDEEHARAVEALALQFFDDTARLHDLGPRDRLLLRASAWLHDVGDRIRYEGHHKHSQYIIEHSDVMGLSRGERSVVAQVARYHRKGDPNGEHPGLKELSREDRSRVRKLTALLRVADALDKEHLGRVGSMRALAHDTRRIVELRLTGTADRTLEEWALIEKSKLFEETFGYKIVVAK